MSIRKVRNDCTAGASEKKNWLPPGTIRNADGIDTRSDRKIATIHNEAKKK